MSEPSLWLTRFCSFFFSASSSPPRLSGVRVTHSPLLLLFIRSEQAAGLLAIFLELVSFHSFCKLSPTFCAHPYYSEISILGGELFKNALASFRRFDTAHGSRTALFICSHLQHIFRGKRRWRFSTQWRIELLRVSCRHPIVSGATKGLVAFQPQSCRFSSRLALAIRRLLFGRCLAGLI